jgi:hypothetical protein
MDLAAGTGFGGFEAQNKAETFRKNFIKENKYIYL